MRYAAVFALLLSVAGAVPAAKTVWLDDLELALVRQGYGRAQANRSIREQPLSVGGRVFERGVGSHARAEAWLSLNRGSERFQAEVGLDDRANGPGSVVFRVYVDDVKRFDSGVMRPGDAAKSVDLDLRGAEQLLLLVDDAGDGINFDHGDWGEARLTVTGADPRVIAVPDEPREILTPPAGPGPRLNHPVVYGCRPGRPFLLRLACQGRRPLRFVASGLPAGLKLDAERGILTGTAPPAGTYLVSIGARNAHGSDQRRLRIVAGQRLALTPPMGWNDWYAHYDRITDALVRSAAERLLSSGLADVGYDMVCIDDCWARRAGHPDPARAGAARDAEGHVLTNDTFPDMADLTAYLHERGLKAGIYTSPGPTTCAGYTGAWQHEAQDAATFVKWGFDLLKYDWCSYGQIAGGQPDLPAMQRPYRLMGALLASAERDVQLNLCQYGMGDVWRWGSAVGGQSWRTGGDLGFELNAIFDVALRNCRIGHYSGPGGWNDPDYIQIGNTGARDAAGQPVPFALSPNEQYSFMSLWSLMAAPLFYSGDLDTMDAFTLNVLGNTEVVEINQDPLGRCAEIVRQDGETFVLAKPLANGDLAVGLANSGYAPAHVSVSRSELALSTAERQPLTVRDVWRQRNLGPLGAEYAVRVPRRSVVLLRLVR